MDREIAELAKMDPREIYPEGDDYADCLLELAKYVRGYAQTARAIVEEALAMRDNGEFVPTPECVSDCYDNDCHSVLCQHYSGPF